MVCIAAAGAADSGAADADVGVGAAAATGPAAAGVALVGVVAVAVAAGDKHLDKGQIYGHEEAGVGGFHDRKTAWDQEA